jgi:hypothetical protein
MSERSDKPLILVPGPAPDATGIAITQERRITSRYPITADAEIFDIGTQTRVAGRGSDVSSNGCYIDTISPLTVGAVVQVSLRRGMEEFAARAIVMYAVPSMGMGLAFTEIKPEHQAILQKWIAELSGEQSPEPVVEATEAETGMLAGNENLRQVLNELINLMIRRKIITEKEGAGLLRQMFS